MSKHLQPSERPWIPGLHEEDGLQIAPTLPPAADKYLRLVGIRYARAARLRQEGKSPCELTPEQYSHAIGKWDQ